MARTTPRLGAFAILAGTLLIAIFAGLVLHISRGLREEIHQRMIERTAAVLQPAASQMVADSESANDSTHDSHAHLVAALRSSRQSGVLAMAIFDSDGATLEQVPKSQIFVELPFSDYTQLLEGGQISRFHRDFPLHRHFPGLADGQRTGPVLEVLFPIHSRLSNRLLGFARYYIDGRSFSGELAAIDQRIDGQISGTLTIGSLLIAAVVGGAFVGLRRAQRLIAERNERLARANFELTLSAKASALGQITSHLIHGLQGPVAGLRAVVASRNPGETPDWQSAADYTDRLQALIGETVAMLSDLHASASYEISAAELAGAIHQKSANNARERGVTFHADARGETVLDSHRGSLLCLIATNLIENAVAAVGGGGVVRAEVRVVDSTLRVSVQDNGPGICETVRARLFQPGRTGRAGGTGLGLAISHLLARQIGAELVLKDTGPAGTVFEVSLPLIAPAPEG